MTHYLKTATIHFIQTANDNDGDITKITILSAIIFLNRDMQSVLVHVL